VIDVDLAFPFSAGLVAAFNPCGFAMLPTYLAYFLGLEDTDTDQGIAGNILRGLAVGLTMTAGFFLVFGTFGIVTSHLVSRSFINERIPWVTLVLGVLMIPFGIAMLRGYEPKVGLPRMNRGTGSRQLGSVFLFGISYAVVSLGCTTPIFIAAVVTSFTSDGLADGIASFLAYAAGMGAVVIFLTMAVALARGSMARNLRRVLPYVNRVSGILLVLAGVYLVAYGWWAIRVLDDPTTASNRFQQAIEDLQTRITNWINDVGAVSVGVALAVVIGALVGGAFLLQWQRRRAPQGESRSMSQPPSANV
jgi:cytochrome c-type biogenesis protein